MKKREPSYTVSGNVNWCSQTKNRVAIWSCNPTPGNIYEETLIQNTIDRWIDKEDVVHIYNGMLLSHKKEWNNAIWSNMDGPRDYHTKWSKSDRERQISYDVTYMWNLKYDMKVQAVKVLVTQSCLIVTSWTPPSMGFSRQEYWSG